MGTSSFLTRSPGMTTQALYLFSCTYTMLQGRFGLNWSPCHCSGSWHPTTLLNMILELCSREWNDCPRSPRLLYQLISVLFPNGLKERLDNDRLDQRNLLSPQKCQCLETIPDRLALSPLQRAWHHMERSIQQDLVVVRGMVTYLCGCF